MAKGNKNGMWVGDKVSYNALHSWVTRNRDKPKECEHCGKEKRLDAANISGEYKRDISDWEWLCRRCHMIKDGRLKILITNYNSQKLELIHCAFCAKEFLPVSNAIKFCGRECYYNSRRKIPEQLNNYKP